MKTKNHRSPERRLLLRAAMLALAGLGLTLGTAQATPDTKAQKNAEDVARKVNKARKAQARQSEAEAEALVDFQKAIVQYQRLHDRLLSRLAQQDAVTGQALAVSIQHSRSGAKRGQLLLPQVQPLFRRLIAEQLRGPDTLSARKALAEDNPGEDSVPIDVRVNGTYPPGASRSTIPTSLLSVLPVLPECLHYRFVGRSLLIVDSTAQVILDYLPDATPAPRKATP